MPANAEGVRSCPPLRGRGSTPAARLRSPAPFTQPHAKPRTRQKAAHVSGKRLAAFLRIRARWHKNGFISRSCNHKNRHGTLHVTHHDASADLSIALLSKAIGVYSTYGGREGEKERGKERIPHLHHITDKISPLSKVLFRQQGNDNITSHVTTPGRNVATHFSPSRILSSSFQGELVNAEGPPPAQGNSDVTD